MQDMSAFPSTANLFSLLLKKHHYTDALLPNTAWVGTLHIPLLLQMECETGRFFVETAQN